MKKARRLERLKNELHKEKNYYMTLVLQNNRNYTKTCYMKKVKLKL